MNHLSHQEALRRLYSNPLSSLLDQDLRHGHCPQHSAPKINYSSYFPERNNLCEQHPHSCSGGNLDVQKLIENLYRSNEFPTSFQMMSPPASSSGSRSHFDSTPFSPSTQCTSPVSSSGDHFAQFGAIGEPSKPSEFERGAITLESGEVVYGTKNIFTADRVHDLVKMQREGRAPRVVSNKVFVGGITHAMNRESINTFFAQFGNVFVDWPVKGPRTNVRGKQIPMSSYSYLFLVYQDEQSVLNLMAACKNPADNVYYVGVPGYREMFPYQIQIRPWFVRNAFYIEEDALHSQCVDIHRTVFVGGLPRIVTASEIAKMFSEFGKVLLVTIDIDQDYGYPKGAARVVFKTDKSFKLALEKRYLKFNNIDSSKTTIEIKPYVMEDVGCDQCGGLWFNPFLDIYEQLKTCVPKEKFSLENVWTPMNDELGDFESWKCFQSSDSAPRDEELFNDFYPIDNDRQQVINGARKFVELADKFIDDGEKMVVNGVSYDIGPDLWQLFVPPPQYETRYEPVQMRVEQQIENYLRLEHTNVYSNKSSYCKEAPCRQYYCPSCSNKLHSGPNQHVLLPAGKPERRPRKDKNMYLVTQK